MNVSSNSTFFSFEIKCLSKKNPVKVGEYSYDFKDKACPLESKTLITLGKSLENFERILNPLT